MTFPAWSSFLTGLGPGRHGIFDFSQKVPGAYRIRFVNATDRSGESLFATASRAGRRVLVLGMPATFPPEPVAGLLVCGFDAPVSTGTDASSASDPRLYERIASRAGPWMRPDLDEAARGEAWHERALGVLLARIERKTAFAREALRTLRAEGSAPDLMTVVFAESDTVGHHFWRDHDPGSPRHEPGASAARRSAVAAVYEALDAACGELRAAFGEDALCLVVSDHGMGGASRRVVHLNQRLADCGLLRRASAPAALSRDALARSARDLALRALPPRVAQALFRRARGAAARLESRARFGGLDWSATAAFAEEVNTQPGVWLNLRGRESEGCVAAEDRERVRREVIDALLDWKLPTGAPVVSRARPREEVYSGPHAARAPDVVVELALDEGYGLSLVATPWHAGRVESVRTLSDDELAGGRGRGMNGTHRAEGILIATGEQGLAQSAALPASIVDVAPTLLDALGIRADGPRDGVSMRRDRIPYSSDEQALVAARLRALGYLE
jgi:predicted AlkP superfamily phosphohydrolase/phosphomutase